MNNLVKKLISHAATKLEAKEIATGLRDDYSYTDDPIRKMHDYQLNGVSAGRWNPEEDAPYDGVNNHPIFGSTKQEELTTAYNTMVLKFESAIYKAKNHPDFVGRIALVAVFAAVVFGLAHEASTTDKMADQFFSTVHVEAHNN
ncbi:hypothetical protein AWB71_05993 [Caballeronia peredens]|nr:hypothetical protein AWB71_05993 [Caballeronia peredens]